MMARPKALAVTTESMAAGTPAILAVVESEAAEVRPQHAGQPREALLLRIGQALIERLAGLGHFLQRRARLAHPVGALGQAIERAARRLALLRRRLSVRRRVALLRSGLHALEAKLRRLAQRLLERRPVLGLVGRQFETGPERRDTGIGERAKSSALGR